MESLKFCSDTSECLLCGKIKPKYAISFNNKQKRWIENKKHVSKYCSRECARTSESLKHQNQKTKMLCKQCGKEKYVRPGYAKLHYFCSVKCSIYYNKNKRKKAKPRTKPYEKKKYKCIYCENEILSIYKRKKCNQCKKNKLKKNQKIKRKERYFSNKYKLMCYFGGCCKDCGYNKCHSALCFHHIDPKTKKYKLCHTILVQRKIETIMKEAIKCEMLCVNCHAIKHDKMKISNKENRVSKIKSKLIKERNGCQKCGLNTEILRVYHFHHIDPHTKKYTLSQVNMWGLSDEEIENEFKKCLVLCGNCHAEEHHKIDIPLSIK